MHACKTLSRIKAVKFSSFSYQDWSHLQDEYEVWSFKTCDDKVFTHTLTFKQFHICHHIKIYKRINYCVTKTKVYLIKCWPSHFCKLTVWQTLTHNSLQTAIQLVYKMSCKSTLVKATRKESRFLLAINWDQVGWGAGPFNLGNLQMKN